MNTFLKILNRLFITLVVCVIAFLLGTKFAFPGNFQVRIVESGSMEPTILTGSVVLIQARSTYEVGDIVTFGEDKAGTIPTTHRIIEEQSNGVFVTQGDANDTPDSAILQDEAIIGKVVFDIPYIGYVVDFARKPVGFILLVVIPALIIVVDEIVIIFKEASRIRKNKKDMREEK